MVLAAGYALAGSTGRTLTIPRMAWSHGVANAFGLMLCGLLAWTVQSRR
jgi:hypothetical protein